MVLDTSNVTRARHLRHLHSFDIIEGYYAKLVWRKLASDGAVEIAAHAVENLSVVARVFLQVMLIVYVFAQRSVIS